MSEWLRHLLQSKSKFVMEITLNHERSNCRFQRIEYI
jgi:hypothetical protein